MAIMYSRIATALSVLAVARAQQIGTNTAEVHPALTWQTCTAPGVCTTNSGSVVLDSNWRWTHNVGGSTNCYTGNTWNAAYCPSDAACATNCAVEGADYTGTYGVTASGNSLRLNFVTTSSQKNIGSRLFLMADNTHYQTFNLLNKEFTFDVDVSALPCGLNGALYFSGMSADGGVAAYPNNKAGARYGVGYCDSQCPRDLKWINGQGNVDGWVPSSNNANTGVGGHGSCCAEMDIWEANSISAAVTPHSCDTVSQTMCLANACGGTYSTPRYGGTCDPDGCDFNSYRQGNTGFYGPGKTIDTTKPLTVVTQFLTDTGTASGTINEIKRFYVQNGVTYANSQSTIPGITGNSITPAYCTAQKTVFGDTNTWATHGGFTSMTNAMKGGMVLVMSLWDDYYANMLWLDSTYANTGLGAARGTCATTSGVPATVEASSPNAYVIYSNIKVGAINSTFNAVVGGTSGTGTTSSTKAATSTTTASGSTGTGLAAHYAQCGGYPGVYTGPTACVAPYTCVYSSQWYSQCL